MDKLDDQQNAEIEIYIYPKFITKKGKRIFPKNGKCFKIPISSFKKNKKSKEVGN